jgi:hypothetical protein
VADTSVSNSPYGRSHHRWNEDAPFPLVGSPAILVEGATLPNSRSSHDMSQM